MSPGGTPGSSSVPTAASAARRSWPDARPATSASFPAWPAPPVWPKKSAAGWARPSGCAPSARTGAKIIVISMPTQRLSAGELHQSACSRRGEMENRIKEIKVIIFADRMSARLMRSNWVHPCLSSFACVLTRPLLGPEQCQLRMDVEADRNDSVALLRHRLHETPPILKFQPCRRGCRVPVWGDSIIGWLQTLPKPCETMDFRIQRGQSQHRNGRNPESGHPNPPKIEFLRHAGCTRPADSRGLEHPLHACGGCKPEEPCWNLPIRDLCAIVCRVSDAKHGVSCARRTEPN